MSKGTERMRDVAIYVAVVCVVCVVVIPVVVVDVFKGSKKQKSDTASMGNYDEKKSSQNYVVNDTAKKNLGNKNALDVCIAFVVQASHVRELGSSPKSSAMLVLKASMFWVGTVEDWFALVNNMNIQVISDLPSVDGKEVIVTYKAVFSELEFPADRFAVRSKLKELNASNKLNASDIYDKNITLNLLRLGFKG